MSAVHPFLRKRRELATAGSSQETEATIILSRQADPAPSLRVAFVSRQMKDPYQGLSEGDRKIVALIATAIANGNLLPHNRHSPLAARRVFEALKNVDLMHCEEDRLN